MPAKPEVDRAFQIEILLRPGFGAARFAWTISGEEAAPVEGAGGHFLYAVRMDIMAKPDALIVPGNIHAKILGKAAINRTLRLRREGCQVILLAEAAVEIIGAQKSLRGPVTPHWENKLLLQESYVDAMVSDSISEQFDRFVTAAGMGTTTALIAQHIPVLILRSVNAVLLHDRLRPFSTTQPAIQSTALTDGDPVMRRAIQLMELNLDADVPFETLAAQIGVSLRSLERKFAAAVSMPPAAFFREL